MGEMGDEQWDVLEKDACCAERCTWETVVSRYKRNATRDAILKGRDSHLNLSTWKIFTIIWDYDSTLYFVYSSSEGKIGDK